MPIIELAHVQLKDGLTASDPDLLKNTKEVARVIQEYSSLPTLFFQQIDDPTVLFVVGAWPDKDKHQHGFNGSPQQGEILGLIKDQMGIDWMHYMDVDQNDLPIRAPVLAFIKQTLPKDADRRHFDKSSAEAIKSLDGAKYRAVEAWNIQKDSDEAHVKVHFTGWDNVEDATRTLTDTAAKLAENVAQPADTSVFYTKLVKLD